MRIISAIFGLLVLLGCRSHSKFESEAIIPLVACPPKINPDSMVIDSTAPLLVYLKKKGMRELGIPSKLCVAVLKTGKVIKYSECGIVVGVANSTEIEDQIEKHLGKMNAGIANIKDGDYLLGIQLKGISYRIYFNEGEWLHPIQSQRSEMISPILDLLRTVGGDFKQPKSVRDSIQY